MANIRYRYIHSLAALFLIVGMTVQFVMAYRQARRHVQESIDLKMQIAHQKVVFELYDAYEAVQQMEGMVSNHLSKPDLLLGETRSVLKQYPSFFSCYAAFPENYYPEKGKWFCPCSYRLKDDILTIRFGDNKPILTKSGILPIKANMPLGFDAKYQFEEQSCEMADGEMLVLYTDGVTEARNSQREMMGMDRWVEMVMRGGDLLKAVQEYMGQAEPIDDITLMTICKKEFIGPK